MKYLNQFHKESVERKLKKIAESQKHPMTPEEINRLQSIIKAHGIEYGYLGKTLYYTYRHKYSTLIGISIVLLQV